MAVEKYEMTEEEYNEFSQLSIKIIDQLNEATPHLISPVLIKLTVSSYLQLKGFEEDVPGARQLHDELISDITHLMVDKTNALITQLRERN